ncbi:LysR substrate-binding domain-containing protein [Pseudomonas sp. NPDC007930]|uniref:LysR family transcriptional regulator n=1 Tax=Pseudomonas sp. NPDC007930 TaxID=3364417 RepID=UPI0036E529AB
MNLPDLNLLVALHILLEEGSVAAAARRMHLSAPAMSRTLGRIRQVFDDPILVRSGRGLVPTPRALALREQARGLVEQAHGLFTEGRELQLATLRRGFTLRANDVFIGAWGGALLQQFNAQAPQAVLRFLPESDLDHAPLGDGSLDLAIGSPRSFGPDIKVQHLVDCGFSGVARAGHPLFEHPISAARLAAFDHVAVSRRGLAEGPLDAALAAEGLARQVRYVVPTFHAALFAVAGSDLVLPNMPLALLATLAPLGLALRPFNLPFALPSVPLQQAWHPRLHHDPAHRWLRQLVRQVAQAPSLPPTP